MKPLKVASTKIKRINMVAEAETEAETEPTPIHLDAFGFPMSPLNEETFVPASIRTLTRLDPIEETRSSSRGKSSSTKKSKKRRNGPKADASSKSKTSHDDVESPIRRTGSELRRMESEYSDLEDYQLFHTGCFSESQPQYQRAIVNHERNYFQIEDSTVELGTINHSTFTEHVYTKCQTSSLHRNTHKSSLFADDECYFPTHFCQDSYHFRTNTTRPNNHYPHLILASAAGKLQEPPVQFGIFEGGYVYGNDENKKSSLSLDLFQCYEHKDNSPLSIPPEAECEPETKLPSRNIRRCWLYGIAVVIIAVSVIIIVGVTTRMTRKEAKRNIAPSSAPTYPPSQSVK